MIAFLAQFGSTILVCVLLAAIIFGIIRKIVRDKKNGSCHCDGCSGCVMSDVCHHDKQH